VFFVFFFLRGNAGLEIATITVIVIITLHATSNETTGVLPFFLQGLDWILRPIQFENGSTYFVLKGEYNYYYTLSDKAPLYCGLVKKVNRPLFQDNTPYLSI